MAHEQTSDGFETDLICKDLTLEDIVEWDCYQAFVKTVSEGQSTQRTTRRSIKQHYQQMMELCRNQWMDLHLAELIMFVTSI